MIRHEAEEELPTLQQADGTKPYFLIEGEDSLYFARRAIAPYDLVLAGTFVFQQRLFTTRYMATFAGDDHHFPGAV